jgi:rhamnulokinase
MKRSRHIAVDMGAGSVRVLLGELDNGIITYNEVYRFNNEIKTVDGADKWDIEAIYNEIVKGINLVIESFPDVESIGVDSWGVDYVLLDKNGKLVEMPYAYRDNRTSGKPAQWKELMSEQETFRRTGINFYVFNTLFQLLAAKDSDALKQADRLLFIPNYIYYRLTGEQFNEVSIASTSQLLKVDAAQFDEEILKKLGLEPGRFAPLKDAGHVVGELKEQALLPNHIQAVTICSHDTASAVAAIPVEKDDFLFIATGTWCILGTESRSPLLTEPARALGFTNERGCENTYRIIKNIVGLWLVQGIRKAADGDPDFGELEKMAKESEKLDLLVDPEDDLFFNPGNMMEAFDRYLEKTGQPVPESTGQYVDIAYRSLSVAFAYYLGKLERLKKKTYHAVHVFGGGSRSDLFCQYIADHTGKTVIAGPVEAATYGNIMVQAIALGKIKDVKEGRKIVRNSVNPKRFEPQLPESEKEKMYRKYLTLKTY